jgi:hypothetical protein
MIVFFMGFGLAAGLFIGIPVALLTNYTLRDVDSHIINIPDEQFIQPPEDGVDILDLNAIELYEEYLELQSLGDALTLDELQKRYGLIFHEKLDTLLTEEARNMPLSTLLSMEGVHAILNGLYIGNIEGYVCLNPDGTDGTPESEGAYWFDQNNQRVIRGLEEKIANLSLDDFVDGRINVDYLLHEITIADIFGYELKDGKYYSDGKLVTGVLGEFAHCHIDSDEIQETINGVKFGAILGYTEEDGRWFDESGEKVTGAMGVFAGACIDTLDDTIDSALLGDLLGYTYNDEESSWYDSNGKKVSGVMSIVADSKIDTVGTTINETDLGVILGYSYDESENWWIDNSGNKVHTFMNTISGKKLDGLGNLISELKVSDVIPLEEREKGLMSLLDPDTTLLTLSPDLNKIFTQTPMSKFVEAELVTFSGNSEEEIEQAKQKFLSSKFAELNISELLGMIVSLPIY